MNLSYMYQYCTLDISHQPSGVTGQLHLMTSWQLQQPSKDNKLTTVLTNCTLLFSEDRYWPIDGPIFLGARLVYLSRPNLLVCWALIRVAQNVSRPAVPIFLQNGPKVRSKYKDLHRTRHTNPLSPCSRFDGPFVLTGSWPRYWLVCFERKVVLSNKTSINKIASFTTLDPCRSQTATARRRITRNQAQKRPISAIRLNHDRCPSQYIIPHPTDASNRQFLISGLEGKKSRGSQNTTLRGSR
jgi:hypothetical protein